MISDGDYATPAIVCKARGGICFFDSKCGICDYAKKYKTNKIFFSMMETCHYRNEKGICTNSLEPCLRTECAWMLKFAEMLI